VAAALSAACSSSGTPGGASSPGAEPAEPLVIAPAASAAAGPEPETSGGRVVDAPPAPSARKVPGIERASERFDRGIQLFQESDFEGALAAFQAAYAIVPNASVLRNIAVCQEQLRRYDDALATYERYLSTLDSSDPRAASVQQRIADLKARLARP
jgi:tetratricopeptide (TPR) repeat protein